ncbi:MAG TPA: hypothetical protein VD995_02690 [Azospirillum sp.]|nr:hypothetical protein [Azospirillum sp.]
MTLYRYSGPPSGATIDGKEVLLHPGADVELSADNGYVRTLLALGHLTEVPKPVVPAPARKAKPEEAA